MRILPAALVAAIALSVLSAPPRALAATPAVQTPASSAAQQANTRSAMLKAAAQTRAQRKAAHNQMMTKMKAAHAARIAAGKGKKAQAAAP
jgi:hypothetical protein